MQAFTVQVLFPCNLAMNFTSLSTWALTPVFPQPRAIFFVVSCCISFLLLSTPLICVLAHLDLSYMPLTFSLIIIVSLYFFLWVLRESRELVVWYSVSLLHSDVKAFVEGLGLDILFHSHEISPCTDYFLFPAASLCFSNAVSLKVVSLGFYFFIILSFRLLLVVCLVGREDSFTEPGACTWECHHGDIWEV